ncbi:Signal recognition particle [Conglomerata obtusa]
MLSDAGKSLSNTLSALFKSPLAPNDIDLTIKSICTTLLHTNVSPKIILQFRTSLREKLSNIPLGASKPKYISAATTEALIDILDPHSVPFRPTRVESNSSASTNKSIGKSNVVMFVGLQGCGKTTTVCKYANFYKRKGLRVGIVCADTFRAGAFEQVKQNALKIKVPFYGSDDPDPIKVAREGVERFKKEKFDLILVDTSGRNTQEKELFTEMKEISDTVLPSNIVFVMDAGIGQSAEGQARGFAAQVKVGSIILTKIDGTNKAGGALSSVAVTGCPIDFIGTGEGMDDFDLFDVRRFVNKLLGKGDVEGLFEKVEGLQIDEKKMMDKISRGQFTLKDFYDQFQQLMSLGPLNKLLEMMPGMGNVNLPDNDSFKKMICIFDSLSKKELESDGSCFEEISRVKRVAKGSGTSPSMVIELIQQFKMISGMMKKLGKIPGFGDLASKDPSKMTLAEKTKMKNQMKGMLPKNMFDQMSQFLQ